MKQPVPLVEAACRISTSFKPRPTYVCFRCQQRAFASSPARASPPNSSPQSTNAGSTNDPNSFTERLRRKIWGTPDPSAESSPPVPEDPYGDKSIRARDDQGSKTLIDQPDPSAPIDMGDYVPASTWDGLETTGGREGWWEDAWNQNNPFEGCVRFARVSGARC